MSRLMPDAAPYPPADAEAQSLKIPPHSIEAEQAVLGGIFLDKDAWVRVAETVQADDFYRQDHRLIFQAIADLDKDGKPFDLVTVAEWLESHQQLDDAGGLAYLAAIAEKTPSAGNIGVYADIVRKRSVLRQLITATGEINETVFNSKGKSSEAILDIAEQSVFEIAERMARGRRSYSAIKELLVAALERVDQLAQKQSAITGIASGFADLDERTAGLQDSELIIVAGRPSMGKAQPLDARVLTLDGWRAMGELRMGDALAAVDGRRSRVAAVYPQGIKDIYRLRFSDGRSAEACAEHLWRAHHAGWNAPCVLSTAALRHCLTEQRYKGRLWVEHCNGEFGHARALPIPPRRLGAWLAAGQLDNPGRIGLDSCLVYADVGYQRCIAGGVTINATGWPPHHLREELQALLDTPAEFAFVPDVYKTAARPARLAVLRGLLDAGGRLDHRGALRFSHVSERLIDDVVGLARSVGAWARKGRQQPAWLAEIRHPRPALLCAATEAHPAAEGACLDALPVIDSIAFARRAEAQCIAVTHPSGLYITDDYVVTHNTALAINIAEHAAIKEKKSVAVFSMEMSGQQLAMRMMSSLGRVDQHKVRTGKVHGDDWPRLISTVEMLKDAKLFIDDSGALTPAELRAACRRIYREHGLDLVIVDYLQLMQVPDTTENRATEISEISRSLKAMAKELQLPVVALSQLNRSLEQRPNKRPVMSDLRESGAIEQDADVIIFIYRDEVYDEDSADKGLAEIIIGKQRNGPIGAVRLAFLGQFTRFENYIAEEYVPEH